jgi:protein-tyrosine sulfotransferase
VGAPADGDGMRLTLCVIARDESRFLPGCLASVEGVVDQIVVVDTGSTDDTPALARAAGALVVEHPWTDDFAAARNAALPWATGDYLLVLDADERLAPGAGAALRAAIATGAPLLGLLPLYDATTLDATAEEVVSGAKCAAPAVYLPRLLRRTPDLRWEGRIHESVSAWLVRHGGRAATVEAPIVHFGAVPSIREERRKGDRNRALLERLCGENPDAPVPFAYLASERARAGDLAGARAAAEHGWTALRAACAGPGPRPAVVSLATMRAQLALAADDPGTALTTIEEARGWCAEHPNFAFLAGQAAALAGDPLRAVDELAAALDQRGGRWMDPALDGATDWRCRALLARVLTDLGRADEALDQWERVLAENPSHGDAPLQVASLHLAADRPAAALRALEPHLASADAWLLAARATLATGDADTARTLAARAARERWVDPRRRAELGPLLSELRVRAGRFRAGPGPFGTVGALVAGTPFTDPAEVDDATLAVAVDALIAAGDEPGLAALRSRRAQAAVPGVRQRMDALLDARGLSWTDPGEPDFVFVGGAGRSGTTLFRAMLSAHPDLWCPPERKLVPALAEFHARQGSALAADLDAAGVDAGSLDAAAKAWLTVFLRANAPPGRRIAEKTPHNLLHAAWLGRLFPQARFVHVLRDGHAVAESLVRQRWKDPATGEVVPWCRDLESAARYWATVVHTIRAQAAALPGRYLEVRYEDLVTAPRQAMEVVLAFLGERWDDAVLHHERAPVALSARESSSAAVARPLGTDALDLWRARLSAADRTVVARAAGPILDATGYGGAP